TGIFPGRKDSLDEIENNDVIGIPKDPSNAARAYAILQKADLLKLKKDIDLVNVTQNDIIENKHNLEIQEMDSAQIPRALDDLDYGVIPGSIVYSSGLDPSLRLLDEDILEELEQVATTDKKNKDAKCGELVKFACQSDKFTSRKDKHNVDDYWFIPEVIR